MKRAEREIFQPFLAIKDFKNAKFKMRNLKLRIPFCVLHFRRFDEKILSFSAICAIIQTSLIAIWNYLFQTPA
jgi:hypothetical protein